MAKVRHLSNFQIELLKLFNYDLPEKQLLEIKKLLSSYFAKNVTTNIDNLLNDKNWNDETIENIKNEYLRTKYE